MNGDHEPDYRRRLLRATLAYAAKGWHVFPLRPGTKKPAVPNHPAHLCDGTDPRCRDSHTGWEARATTNPERITAAWTRRPYGIGIACGPSQLLVIDLDTATNDGPSGVHSWCQLTSEQTVPDTHTVTTPTGGHHLYFHRPADTALRNTASNLAPRIDTRAIGGYIVAPPTETITGRYRITSTAPVAEAPTWLINRLTVTPPTNPESPTPQPPTRHMTPVSERARRYVDAAIDGETRRLQTATEGTRNHTLFLAAIALGQLIGAGLLDQDTAERVLWANTSHHINTGAYTPNQAAATITSGLNRGKLEPRQLPTNLTNPRPAGAPA